MGTIVFDRPQVLNAFDDDLGREALEALAVAAADEQVRCIVVTGAGRAFCAGEDLGALAGGYESDHPPDLGRTLSDRYNPLIRAIRSAPKPVVAAINGVAAGAGVGIALACDFRIASEHAKLILAFIKVGLLPDSGSIWFLAKMVGAAKAWEIAATGDAVSAQEALTLGLVNQVVAADDFERGWSEFAEGLASGPTRAFALMKSLLDHTASASLNDQLDLEVQMQSLAGQTYDHLEGVRAFLEKRPPSFRGM